MSEEQLIRHCAPTLASIKTGNLFSCACAGEQEVNAFVRGLNQRLTGKGLRVLPIRSRSGHYLIYVYRPHMLENDLNCPSARRLLKSCGYPCASASQCLCRLIHRMGQQEEFPHEIGLFLSYPPEDVYGFIHRKEAAKCSGCWKVYGDVAAARRTFARYKRCSEVYLRLWAQGRSIEQLTVAA